MMLGMLSVPVRTCFVCPILKHESPAPRTRSWTKSWLSRKRLDVERGRGVRTELLSTGKL
jgi:hypothetical protein